jgi:hypothetical protein
VWIKLKKKKPSIHQRRLINFQELNQIDGIDPTPAGLNQYLIFRKFERVFHNYHKLSTVFPMLSTDLGIH